MDQIAYQGPPSAAVADLQDVLRGYDAGEIALVKVPLGAHTGQEFYLERRRGKVRIEYTTASSLENAIYTLLDQWGFRWYGPGENWFVKPVAIPKNDIAGRWITPTFRHRTFFGTGGLDTPVPGDPTNQYKERWHAWKRRNRFSADFLPAGHTGMAFYQENKALLDSHPEWFNGDTGKQFGRFRIEKPAAIEAYKAWARKQAQRANESFVNIGVDPEDGRGGADDPLPPDGFGGLTGWNHADKWWWVANAVASDFRESDPRRVVSMYAYGDGPTNVRVPRFPLRRNVYPILIPYAFQTAYQPQEMVRAWSKATHGKLGLYDYWNITQWSQGLPQFDIYSLKEKLNFWHKNRVDGLYIETTDAAGPMGHAWWLAGQYAFDLGIDFEVAYTQYLTQLFGRAAPVLRQLYDRWSQNPQGAGEVSLSLADLQAAERLVIRDSPEWKRIHELKAYCHFLRLFYEHDGTQASKDRLFSYLYSIHHLMLVQTSAFVGQHYIAPLDKGNQTPTTPSKPATTEEIDAQFHIDCAACPKRYGVIPFAFDARKVRYSEPIPVASWRFGRNPLVYFIPHKSEQILFDAGVESGASELTVFTNDGVLLRESLGERADYTETIEGRTWKLRRFSLRVTAGAKYFFRLRGSFNRLKFHSLVVVFNAHHQDDFDNYAYPVQYFYVPGNCTQLVYEDLIDPAAAPAGRFFLPGLQEEDKGLRGMPLSIKNLYAVTIRPEWRGKVLACSFAHTSWSLKNLRSPLALQKFSYSE